MTATLHFVGGEKGGVGKSVMARILAQYCIDKELPLWALIPIEATPPSSVSMRLRQQTVVDDYQSLDAIAEAIGSRSRSLVIWQRKPWPASRWIDDSKSSPTQR